MSLSKVIPNLYDVRDVLKKCWKEVEPYPVSGGRNCPSRGQCFVTAILVKEIFGGEILTATVNGEKHFWNIIDGIEIDFTSDQYGGDGYRAIAGVAGVPCKFKGTANKRYKQLRKVWDRLEYLAYIF